MQKHGKKKTVKSGRTRTGLRRVLSLIAAAATLLVFYALSGTPAAETVWKAAAGSELLIDTVLGAELGKPGDRGDLWESLGFLRALAVSESAVFLDGRKAVAAYWETELAQNTNPPESEGEENDKDPLITDSPVAETPAPGTIVERTLIPVSGEGYEVADGIYVNNQTSQSIDIAALLKAGPGIVFGKTEPQVLVIHTHGSEAYTPDGEDVYMPTDPDRTEDMRYNVVRVGDEITETLEKAGISVVHDRALYDYPSYSGSYTRSLAAIETYLKKYPSIQFVFDIHRDALEADDGTVYKVVSTQNGEKVAQVMFVVGTNDSGLEHPKWKENLKLALCLQAALNKEYPTLMRPVSLRTARFNQHATTGSLIVEVGSSGNTLQEALASARLFAACVAEVLKSLK
ncbi:stage II sporulation protein P [Papillibacter cinnamivorans]|uniref:Stage II sporulation protein P n=1 Tax=Papillibacter cinnamivorans DSM 12816 TaxID=1122930 RepID=A0A1W2A5Y9_9FIRM|nr:stage II sporulation protein P [Papillibacter cinnamivorans]SMC55841.1 stage II sporulation protein P [Papillibacter cinnamivorans DSM 12816]